MRVASLQVLMMHQFQQAVSFFLVGSRETTETGAEAQGRRVAGKSSTPQGTEIASHPQPSHMYVMISRVTQLEMITPLSSPSS